MNHSKTFTIKRGSIMVEYTKEFYEKRSTSKNPTTLNAEINLLIKRIINTTKITEGDLVLDVGCNDGLILKEIVDRTKAKGYGIDISKDAIQKAKEKNPHPNVKYFISDVTKLNFHDGFFDKIICSEIIEHLKDEDLFIKEIYRVLKPGGLLYATFPNSLKNSSKLFHELCKRVDKVEGHYRRYDNEKTISKFSNFGFKHVKTRYIGGYLKYFFSSMVVHNPNIKKKVFKLVQASSNIQQKKVKFNLIGNFLNFLLRYYLLLDYFLSNSKGSTSFYSVYKK